MHSIAIVISASLPMGQAFKGMSLWGPYLNKPSELTTHTYTQSNIRQNVFKDNVKSTTCCVDHLLLCMGPSPLLRWWDLGEWS